MTRYDEIKKKIEELEREAAEAKAFEERLAANDPKAIADVIHGCTCRWNHNDGCGYEYESWDGNWQSGHSKKTYYDKALKLIDFSNKNQISISKILEIVDVVNKL